MNTIKTLTAALLIMLTYSAMAAGSTAESKMDKNDKKVSAPAFSWGNPEEADTETARVLKYSAITAPAMAWGTPEDLNEEGLQALKIRTRVLLADPEFTVGNPDDLDMQELEKLNTRAYLIDYPEAVIGNPEDVGASGLK